MIAVQGQIKIRRPQHEVFAYFANPTHDKAWRNEIVESSVDGALQKGVRVTEVSYLSKKLARHTQILHCTLWEPSQRAAFETPVDAPFYLYSYREVMPVTAQESQVVYEVRFDEKVVAQALGFMLPLWIIRMKAQSDLRKYLKQLLHKLEA